MNEELQKHTLLLFRGDYEKLQSLYPDLGASPIIRRIVRRFVEQIDAAGSADVENVKVEI